MSHRFSFPLPTARWYGCKRHRHRRLPLVRSNRNQVGDELPDDNPLAIEIVDESLMEMPFGEYLVARRALSRAQLLAALCTQEQHDGVPLADIVCWLGYLPASEVEQFLAEWRSILLVHIS